MRNLTGILCLTLAVLLGSVGVSWSADSEKDYAAYNKGAAAYDRRDYTTAFRIWLSLAQQGYADAQAMLGSL